MDNRTVRTLGAPDLAPFGLLPPGRMIAGYRIEGRAGAGGMGVVYRAVDVELGRLVAVKVIAPALAGDDAFRDRFRSESRRAAALEHPNVLPVYRSGEEDGSLYIAMRYVDGPSLQELIDRRGRLPVGAAVRVVSQVADALDAAHAHGLVHRDVKPGNVLISEADGEERVSLADFGLAVPVARRVAGGDGRHAGTPAYLAPEQIRGDPVDARTDVYSLGCLLFHALTGRVPFVAEGVQATMAAHLVEPPPRPSELVPGLPAGLDEVVGRAMAKRPEDRFAGAGLLAAAARAARADVVVSYDPRDEGVARSLAARLSGQGLETHLARGRAADDLSSALACLVLIGRGELAGWARPALAAAAAVASTDPGFRLVPVLLPGAPDPFDPRLSHLAGRTFVDLRGGTDDPHAVRDLMRAVGASPPEVVSAPARAREASPYRGLESFREEDAPLFFGRDRETSLLVEKLGAGRFLAVLGASGSGKSSLVRAGLVPALRAADDAVRVVTLTPGTTPLGALAVQLAAVAPPTAPSADDLRDDVRALDRAGEAPAAAAGARARLLIVVDQFEEVFSVTSSARDRRAFIDGLVYASTIPGGRTTVVVAMRSDFYPRCADHPALSALVAEHQLLVGPLSPDGLRDAIEEPARRAGLELEPGLVRRILADVSTEPGHLPLLEHLLLELWRRRRGRLLTLEAYAACGGVGGALARRANEVYAGLSADQQAVARRVLLRLTQPGEDTEDTRRRAPLAELTGGGGGDDARRVVEAMSAARLMVVTSDEVTGEPAVEVAHEALIRAWPRLRRWIDADREALRLHRRLTDAAREWSAAGREDGLLYRGARLAIWQERDTAELNDLERAFLRAGVERADRDRAARRRRVRLAVGGLALAAAAIAAVAVVAVTQWRSASDERDVALSRQLAGDAADAAARDPELALLLADRAHRAAPTDQAEQALRQTAFASRVRGALPDLGTRVADVRSVGGGRVLVEGGDGSLHAWEPATDRTGARAVRLGRLDGALWGRVAVTPAGYVTAGDDGAIVLWRDGAPPRAIGDVGASAWDVTPIERGRAVLVAADSGVWRWDIATERGRRLLSEPSYRVRPGEAPGVLYVSRSFASRSDSPIVRWAGGRSVPLPVNLEVNDLEISPDRRLLAVATETGVQVLSTGPAPRRLYFRALSAPGANDVAFAGDGSRLGVAAFSGAYVLRARDGAELAQLQGHDGAVTAIGFGPGARLVSGGGDGATLSWDLGAALEARLAITARTNIGGERFGADGRVTVVDLDGSTRIWEPAGGVTAGLPAAGGPIASAAATPDRRVVVTGGADVTRGRVLVRDAAGRTLLDWSAGERVWAVAIDPGGRRIAAALDDGRVVAASLRPASEPRVIAQLPASANSVAFDPSGTMIASGSSDGSVRLSRGAGGTRVLGSHDESVVGLAFSPDGTRLASAGFDKTARVWDVAGREPAVLLRGQQGPVYAVAFTADGDRLVSGGDGGLRVWDWRRGATLLSLPGAAFQVDADGPGPRILYITRGASGGVASVVECDVCGPISDVRALVSARTTRELTEQEQADLLGD